MFKITVKFTTGSSLAGRESSMFMPIAYQPGWVCKKPRGGLSYKVISCVEIKEKT